MTKSLRSVGFKISAAFILFQKHDFVGADLETLAKTRRHTIKKQRLQRACVFAGNGRAIYAKRGEVTCCKVNLTYPLHKADRLNRCCFKVRVTADMHQCPIGVMQGARRQSLSGFVWLCLREGTVLLSLGMWIPSKIANPFSARLVRLGMTCIITRQGAATGVSTVVGTSVSGAGRTAESSRSRPVGLTALHGLPHNGLLGAYKNHLFGTLSRKFLDHGTSKAKY